MFYVFYIIYVNNLKCCYLSYNYLCDFYYLSNLGGIINYLELVEFKGVNGN